MNIEDVAFAWMLAMGILVKLSGPRAWVQVYLIWANGMLAAWSWHHAMPLTAVVFIASAVVAAIYAYREFGA